MNAMEHENGWSILLRDPVFDHMEGSVEYDDARRLLTVIGKEFYLKGVSVNPKDAKWAVPERQDTIGYKVMELKSRLDGWLHGPSGEQEAPAASEAPDWLNRFLNDLSFQHYTSQLLESLCYCAWNSLPNTPQTTSFQEREQDTKLANTEELEDEVGRAEAARKSAEAAEKAADNAKITADSIMPNMLTTLGVFIAIVIAVVACYLSLILSEPYIKTCPGETPKILNIVMLLLMGHLLLNIIFLLLYLISKMSAHPLSCHCLVGDQADCQKCDPELRAQCRFRHKLWLRYPYVVAMNGAFLAAYGALGLWYLVRRFFGASMDAALDGSWLYAAVLVGAAVILMIAATVIVSLLFLRSPRRELESAQKKARKKEASTQAKEQKAENERRSIRDLKEELARQKSQLTELQDTVDHQKTQLSELEAAVNQMKEKLAQCKKEHDNAPVP